MTTTLIRRYSCTGCGSNVRKHHETFKVQHEVRDERGRILYHRVKNKETRRWEEKPRTVEVEARGLGHWECQRRCPASRQKMRVVVTLVRRDK
jgi:hypothetical protein